jgi:hypothetical protein
MSFAFKEMTIMATKTSIRHNNGAKEKLPDEFANFTICSGAMLNMRRKYN